MHHRGAMVLSQRGDLKARRLRYFSVLYLGSLRARAARSCSIRTVTTMTASIEPALTRRLQCRIGTSCQRDAIACVEVLCMPSFLLDVSMHHVVVELCPGSTQWYQRCTGMLHQSGSSQRSLLSIYGNMCARCLATWISVGWLIVFRRPAKPLNSGRRSLGCRRPAGSPEFSGHPWRSVHTAVI